MSRSCEADVPDKCESCPFRYATAFNLRVCDACDGTGATPNPQMKLGVSQ